MRIVSTDNNDLELLVLANMGEVGIYYLCANTVNTIFLLTAFAMETLALIRIIGSYCCLLDSYNAAIAVTYRRGYLNWHEYIWNHT